MPQAAYRNRMMCPDIPISATPCKEAKPPFARPEDPVFKTVPTLRTFKADLARSGIPFADEDGRTVDRHALQTTFISWLGECGVDPRVQAQLARHTPQGVTLKHSQDYSLFDPWAEIGKLPGPHGESRQAARATGTEGAGVVVRPVVRAPRIPGGLGASCCTKTTSTERNPESSKRYNSRENGDSDMVEGMEPNGLEPSTSWLQTRRSPN